MGILELINDPAAWDRFFESKSKNHLSKTEQKNLRRFIDKRGYRKVLENLRAGTPFPHARRIVISKASTAKKRIVYSYPPAENWVCKMLTWHLIRKYDFLFAPCLYSFRPNHGVKQAIRYYTHHPNIWKMYSYKADISNYFNSVPLNDFLPILRNAMEDDPEGCCFLESLLLDPYVWSDGKLIEEEKGLMAGVPQASFYANLYLKEIDNSFFSRHILYGRYSDDVLIFAETKEQILEYRDFLHRELSTRGLLINPSKEEYYAPHEAWTFLGFSCSEQGIDICPHSIKKLKGKVRRKRRALARWQKRHDVPGEKTALAYIRSLNRKLFENDNYHELTWARWFCPVITTTKSLELLDHYIVDNIRMLASGTQTKSRFNIRYDEIKQLGFRSLVHEYYTDWPEEKI